MRKQLAAATTLTEGVEHYHLLLILAQEIQEIDIVYFCQGDGKDAEAMARKRFHGKRGRISMAAATSRTVHRATIFLASEKLK